MNDFAHHLRTTRAALGLSQDDLARRLDTCTQTISNWETERVLPWPKTQTRVLDVLAGLAQPRVRKRVSDLL